MARITLTFTTELKSNLSNNL